MHTTRLEHIALAYLFKRDRSNSWKVRITDLIKLCTLEKAAVSTHYSAGKVALKTYSRIPSNHLEQYLPISQCFLHKICLKRFDLRLQHDGGINVLWETSSQACCSLVISQWKRRDMQAEPARARAAATPEWVGFSHLAASRLENAHLKQCKSSWCSVIQQCYQALVSR